MNKKRCILGLIIFLSIIVGLLSFNMVPVSPVRSPLQVFSAERAFEHIKIISLNPHPIGSDEIEQVRNYIINEITNLGIVAKIQKSAVPDYYKLNNDKPVEIKNIYAILPGTNSTGSILLVGHYDTVPLSPGANDDSSAVATLLETARAILSAQPLQNDVIILFTDAEEPGQYRYGARLFTSNYQSINDIRLILNFEALGRTGPSIMFETGFGNDWLIEGLEAGSPNPIAFSFMNDLIRVIAKGGTDFTAFEEVGINGLNFAYLFERTIYHTMLDNIESLDKRSLQHQGDYALNLARHFGNIDLSKADSNTGSNYVFHSFFDSIILKYPTSWTLPLTFLIGIILFYLIAEALRRGFIKISGIILGSILSFLEIILVTIFLSLAWWGLDAIHLNFNTVVEPTVKAHFLFIAFLFLTVTLMITARIWLSKKLKCKNFDFGPILFWWLLTTLTSLYLPGFNIILLWPLFFSLFPLSWVVLKKPSYNDSWIQFTLISLCVTVSIVLITAPIYLLFQTIGTSSPGFSGSPNFPIIGFSLFFWAMLLSLLLPHLQFLVNWYQRKVVHYMLIIAIVFLVLGIVFPGIDIKKFVLIS